MLTTRRPFQRSGVQETQAEKDLSRILPPGAEDLSSVDTGTYGLSRMGDHTVAGVALASRRTRPEQADAADAAREARFHARQADRAARDAQHHAQQADAAAQHAADHADKADAFARAAQGSGRRRARASTGSAQRFLRGAIVPHATAQELLEIRAALVARVP